MTVRKTTMNKFYNLFFFHPSVLIRFLRFRTSLLR
jgi:hypothetical protein